MWLIIFFLYNCSGEYVTDITVTELPRIFLLTMTTPSTAAHTHTLQDMQVPHPQHRHADVAAALSTRLKILYQLFPPLRNLFTSDASTLNAMAGPTHCGSHLCHAFATWIEQFSNFDDFWTWWKIDDHGESNGNDQDRLNYQRATCLKLCWKRLPWFAICGSQQRTHWSALPRRPFIPSSKAEPNALCINLHIHAYP